MKFPVKRVAKAVIAIIVVAGLILATRGAISQWKRQRDSALQRVAKIDQAIRLAETETQRQTLLIAREDASDQIPYLTNLRWSRIGIASVLYAIGLIPGGLVLYEATRVLGYRVRVRDAVSAQLVGHLGKYVPGKAMVVVIRAGRLAVVAVPILAGSIAVFLETILMMAVGAAVAGCLIFFLPVPRWIAWAALVGGVASTLPTLPPVMKWVVLKVGLRANKGEQENEPAAVADPVLSDVSDDWRFFTLAWAWQLMAWLFIGASFSCLVTSIPGGATEYSTTSVYAASVASISLAMVVGFASLLPGGAGVRELTLAVVLAPVVGQSQALLAAILARLLFIAVELLCVVVVTMIQRLR